MPTYVADDGISLHYDVSGEGRPLVVLHGGAALHPEYLGDLAGLGGRLVMPHLRGVGESPMPADPETGSFWRQAADIEALRRELGLAELVLAGHSAGTRLAIAYAAQFPDRLAGLLLITPPSAYLVDVPSDADTLIDERRGDPVFDAAMAARTAGPDLSGEDDLSSEDTFNEWQVASAPVGYAAWTPLEQAHSRVGRYHLPAARAYFSVDPPADLPARLGAVRAPVRVLAGAKDCTTGLAQVLALSRLFPAGDAVVLDDCGHFPWVERPALFRRAAEQFLAGL